MIPIDIFPSPAIVVDAGLKLVEANARAEKLASTAEFFRLAKNGKLTLIDSEAEIRLAGVLRNLHKNGSFPAQDFVICHSRPRIAGNQAASSKSNRLLIIIVSFPALAAGVNFLLYFQRLHQRRALNFEALRREFVELH